MLREHLILSIPFNEQGKLLPGCEHGFGGIEERRSRCRHCRGPRRGGGSGRSRRNQKDSGFIRKFPQEFSKNGMDNLTDETILVDVEPKLRGRNRLTQVDFRIGKPFREAA